MPANGTPLNKTEDGYVGRGHQGKSDTDAVHPFFTSYRHQLAEAGTDTADDLRYFCKECDVYFPLSMSLVVEHFEKRAHMPVDSCVYCGGPVCEYFHNGVRCVYHNCGEVRAQSTSTSDIPVSISMINSVKNKLSFCDIS